MTIEFKELTENIFNEYKKEYQEWVNFMNEECQGQMEMPCDELLVSLALKNSLQSFRELNAKNK